MVLQRRYTSPNLECYSLVLRLRLLYSIIISSYLHTTLREEREIAGICIMNIWICVSCSLQIKTTHIYSFISFIPS